MQKIESNVYDSSSFLLIHSISRFLLKLHVAFETIIFSLIYEIKTRTSLIGKIFLISPHEKINKNKLNHPNKLTQHMAHVERVPAEFPPNIESNFPFLIS